MEPQINDKRLCNFILFYNQLKVITWHKNKVGILKINVEHKLFLKKKTITQLGLCALRTINDDQLMEKINLIFENKVPFE
jgi:hypothetical protein